MPFGVDDAIGIGLTTAQVASGLINAGKTKKQADKLERTRPMYQESPETAKGLALAESELANGMSAEAKTAYEQGLDRDLSNSLDAILKGGGSTNNVAAVFDSSAQGRQRLNIMKDNLRVTKVNQLVNQQQLAEQERKTAWAYNQFNPWADKVQANAAARQKASDQIWGGAQSLASAGANLGARSRWEKQQRDYFGYSQATPEPNAYSTQLVEAPDYNFNIPFAPLQNTPNI